jgi:RimJ/RimL family protein N-acetyltransferase
VSLLLKKATRDHAERLFRWVQENPQFITSKGLTLKKQIKRILSENRNQNTFYFVIYEGGVHIGSASIKYINYENREAALGILIGTEFQNSGYCQQVIMQIRDIAKGLGLSKLYLTVNRKNIAAIKCYQKSGFKVKRG